MNTQGKPITIAALDDTLKQAIYSDRVYPLLEEYFRAMIETTNAYERYQAAKQTEDVRRKELSTIVATSIDPLLVEQGFERLTTDPKVLRKFTIDILSTLYENRKR